MKKVLVLCTGNSCRSIMGEGLINKYLADDEICAISAGSNPSGRVNPNAIKALEEEGIDTSNFSSKSIDDVIDEKVDLVVTVCSNAKESCPMFPGNAPVIHVGFEDPDGKEFDEFIKTRDLIKDKLLPVVKSTFMVGEL